MDQKAALAWFEKAAEQGMLEAQLAAAGLQARGFEDHAPDLEAAHTWYSRAADQGYEAAMVSMKRIESMWKNITSPSA